MEVAPAHTLTTNPTSTMSTTSSSTEAAVVDIIPATRKPSQQFKNAVAAAIPALLVDRTLAMYTPFQISCQPYNVSSFIEAVGVTLPTPPMTPEAQEQCCQIFEKAVNSQISYRQPRVATIPVRILWEREPVATAKPWCVAESRTLDLLDYSNVSLRN